MATTRGVILIVDDEQGIRNLLVDCLEAAGYTAYAAQNAAEAIEILAQHPETRLLLSDIVMPGTMSGFDLAAVVQQGQPGLKVIFMSGYVPVLASGERRLILRKPFRVQQVLQTVDAAFAALGGDDAEA